MSELNKAMDLATFEIAARDQKPLLGTGLMTETRWAEHAKQLVESKTIKSVPDLKNVFRNLVPESKP
jgi:hypothetical protein